MNIYTNSIEYSWYSKIEKILDDGNDFMRVEKVITSDLKERYMLLDERGDPVEVVLRFVKYKDNTGAARNTLKAYCYHLKLFFEFLEQHKLDFRDVGIDDMALFMSWLHNPAGNIKVHYLLPQTPARKPRTINTIISSVLGFYDYIMRHEEYSVTLSERLTTKMSGSKRNFKDFLFHITKDKLVKRKLLYVKVPKEKPKILSKEQISKLIDNCSNNRDKLLIYFLWESSMRIGEALALWLEDIDISACKIHIKDRGELHNYAEIKTVNSPRTIDVSMDLINQFMDYVAEYHTDEVDTNHVFIKISGKNKYNPMQYEDVVSLFNRLKLKASIQVNPHMLRHSSLTELRRSGWQPEHLRIRAGHAMVQTTLQLYVHPSDEDIRADWEKAMANMKLKKDGEIK